MPRIILKVTDGPKWSAQENRFLTNGDQVVLEADTDEALAVLVARHSHHCKEILEGELPKSLRRPSGAFRRPSEGQEEPSALPKPSEPSEGSSGIPKMAPKTHEAATGGFQCPKCFQSFKSERGLQIHFGHTKHDQDDEQEASDSTIIV